MRAAKQEHLFLVVYGSYQRARLGARRV